MELPFSSHPPLSVKRDHSCGGWRLGRERTILGPLKERQDRAQECKPLSPLNAAGLYLFTAGPAAGERELILVEPYAVEDEIVSRLVCP